MDTAPRARTGQSANERFMKKHGKSIARMIAQREVSSGQDEAAASASVMTITRFDGHEEWLAQ